MAIAFLYFGGTKILFLLELVTVHIVLDITGTADVV